MHDTRKSDLQSAGIVIFRALGRKIYRMEEQALREAKRAHNFIWAAAEDYGFEPLFLAFSQAIVVLSSIMSIETSSEIL